MSISSITLPTPFPVGPVNVYLIKDEPLTLVDTGPKTKDALEALREGLRRERVRLADIERIVLTHSHEDHCGLARTILEERRREGKSVEILIHDWEIGHRRDVNGEGNRANQNLLRRAGVPDDEIETMRRLYENVRRFSDALFDEEYDSLRDEMEIEFASGALRVVHTPGHTPGSCSLLREANRTLIAGDCVLKRITPNPILAADPVDPTRRFPSLAEYLVSLARIRSLSPTLLYGGHGEPVEDYEELFHRYVRQIDERQANVLRLVPKAGATAWEVARELFPAATEVHRFLAVSEAVAHLDLARSENKLAVEIASDGREVYRRLS